MAENKAKLLEEQKKHILKIKRENVKYALLSILGIFIFLLIWQLAVEFGLVNETRLPKPTTILQTLGYKIYNQAPDGNTLGINILASLQVALTGFLTAMVIGMVGIRRPFHQTDLRACKTGTSDRMDPACSCMDGNRIKSESNDYFLHRVCTLCHQLIYRN